MWDTDDQTSDKQSTAAQRDYVVSLTVSKSDRSSFDGSAGAVKDCNQVQLTSHWSIRRVSTMSVVSRTVRVSHLRGNRCWDSFGIIGEIGESTGIVPGENGSCSGYFERFKI